MYIKNSCFVLIKNKDKKQNKYLRLLRISAIIYTSLWNK